MQRTYLALQNPFLHEEVDELSVVVSDRHERHVSPLLEDSGGQNRGFWWVVSDLKGDLDAD